MTLFDTYLEKCKTDKEIDEVVLHMHQWLPHTPKAHFEKKAEPYRQKLKNTADKKATTAGKNETKA